tara:strand:- start:5122 stop:7107 length:1986 start_codon:yes stop_codon:yes gene_type:complete
MGLHQLLTNLEAGTTADIVDSQPFYSNYNNGGSAQGSSTSLFDSPSDLFKNKSFKFGQGRASDRPNGEFSNEPFTTDRKAQSSTSEGQSLLETFDVPRGGISFATNRAQKDKERIKEFFGTNKGRVFRLKQTGLQLMNPKILSNKTFLEKAKSDGVLDALGGLFDNGGPSLYNLANRTYNPLGTNTTKQIANNHLGFHYDKSGLLPTNAINNPKSNYEAVAKTTDRLNSLRGEHIIDNLKPFLYGGQTQKDKQEQERNKTETLGDLFGSVGEFIVDTAKSILGFSSNILYEYNHGPSSVLGLGRTTIRKYQNSQINTRFSGDLINDKDNEYILTINTEGYTPFNSPDSLMRDRGIRKFDSEGKIRETFRGAYTGNPGALTNVNGVKKRNLSYEQVIEKSIDKINAANIIEYKYNNSGSLDSDFEDPTLNDFIKFYFDVYTDKVNSSGIPQKTSRIQFRAFLESFGDEYNSSWNEFNYAGRAEPFYTYKSFNRSINFSFKIAAQSRHEIIPLYKKLNYLVSTTAPTYSNLGGIDDDSPRMRGTFVKVTIGDLLDNVPGFFSNIGLSWSKEYPWEIKLNPNSKDKNIYQNPHVLDVKCSFTPIHNFIPQTSIDDSPFIVPLTQLENLPIEETTGNNLNQTNTDNEIDVNMGLPGALGSEGFNY